MNTRLGCIIGLLVLVCYFLFEIRDLLKAILVELRWVRKELE